MSVRHIVIIGGGFTGTALAIHLGRLGKAGLKVTVIEPREQLAQGVAYSTNDPAHRINVPAMRMQLAGDEEGAFERWYRASPAFQADPAAQWLDGNIYPQRGQFARWVADQFRQTVRHTSVVLNHVCDRAVAMHNGEVITASGRRYQADEVVLAISHPPPALPSLLSSLRHDPRIIADPWRRDALAGVGVNDRLAIIGLGLTMADVVASLNRQGFRGDIIAFSRRGQLPRPNLSGSYAPRALEYQRPQQATARSWLRRIRDEVALAETVNQPWQLIIDDIRLHGQQIWQQLSLNEQRRFLRHLRPWWDVHRYRIAPQVSAVLGELQAGETLQVLAARLKAVEVLSDSVTLTLQSRAGKTLTVEADKLVVTTGPAHGALLSSDTLLRQLTSEGVIQPDPLALGIHVNAQSQVLNRQGDANPHLYVVGPAARARFGELMGLPQVAEHAESLARQLLHLPLTTLKERCPPSLTD